MIDTSTGKPIRIETDIEGYSYIRLPASQMEAVGKLFQEKDIAHWAAHLIISVDGGPRMGVIHLEKKADPWRAQDILDAAAEPRQILVGMD